MSVPLAVGEPLAPGRTAGTATARPSSPLERRPVVRALRRYGPFAGLGLYGALRWGTMLAPEPVWRLLGMLGAALALAVVHSIPLRRRWPLALAGSLIALLAMLALAGLPVSWILHARVAVIARSVGDGLAGLPGVLVPYAGFDQPLREAILLGAGVLLLDAALMLAFSRGPLGELRLAVASLPLLVLALVPAALARPALPYLQGALLFVLLFAFVFGERRGEGRRSATLGLLMLAIIGAMVLAPGIDPHRPWVNFERLTGTLAPPGESFDWAQTYGPLQWPSDGRRVLTVAAPRAGYWKTESLNVFDGTAWTTGEVPDSDPLLGVDASSLRRYTETLQVSDDQLSSSDVVAAGTELSAPQGLQGTSASVNVEQGTYQLYPPLHPGEIYRVSVYAPDPSPAQLEHAGAGYPPVIEESFLQMTLPAFASRRLGLSLRSSIVSFPPFGSGAAPTISSGGQLGAAETEAALSASPYGQAYQLAQQLASGSATPYQFAQAVERYLAHGFTYSLDPRPARYPLETFLFRTRLGYCQQFAGAMALLLRMGGVPARVATGFSSGRRADPASSSLGVSDDPKLLPAVRREAASVHEQTYDVSDLDAHAWVEAWFPGYGWLTFDPTPPGPGSQSSTAALTGGSSATGFTPKGPAAAARAHHARTGAGASRERPAAGRSGSGLPLALILGALALAALALAGLAAGILFLRAVRRAADPLGELERAFARSGRPLGAGATLAGIEQRLRSSPAAAGYVRALRLARYGGAPPPAPGVCQRRALRGELALGGGVRGRLRALWALPPLPPRLVRRRSSGF